MSIANALGVKEEQLFDKYNICKNCKWYAEFEGVCCNGDSEHRADFTSEDFSCKKFENGRVEDVRERN